ncbi:MAG: FeoB-associated Cys-rich membrane protein [Clostridia bacterium]|nr:FeoB-associated Cys-rich membrane protein [Clostridia bacterium]
MNIWDIVLVAALAAAVGLAVRKLARNRRSGKTACGCDCGSCTCGCGGAKKKDHGA